ncbi:carboxymuconolactone decarboxylase family protein [Streptomyces sp. P38-E01]|uniref:Carboxymuconolactone decarboxylase family protein n=1 Tax=Streptomyces tardus TaxID=2780544 RepID=A0A949JIM3_9ACTN|nr:carboxymuconolactone decarboxylase family protein [Streptomyces tardus]MBU7600147.1 carboxymuconolactone decarboxylase family protein [Streptomyces tardus]
MSRPRIAPGDRRQVGLAAWVFSRAAGRVAGTRPPHLFLTLARNRRLFLGWLHFAGRLMPGGKLPRRETELVILRVAHVRACAYEFTHHVRLGRRAGVTEADVERVTQGPEASGWSARERTLLTCADALLADGDLDDAAWASLRSHLSEPLALEYLLLVGHYSMLATTITTLRLQPDRPRPRRRTAPPATAERSRTNRRPTD